MVTWGWNGYRNKSQHRKSTLEKKILPPFQQGFEPETFQSRVRCSNHRAIPAPTQVCCHVFALKRLMYMNRTPRFEGMLDNIRQNGSSKQGKSWSGEQFQGNTYRFQKKKKKSPPPPPKKRCSSKGWSSSHWGGLSTGNLPWSEIP